MEPLQILGMILRGCSRQEVAEALTEEQRTMLAEASQDSLPMNRRQRRELERSGIKIKKNTKKKR